MCGMHLDILKLLNKHRWTMEKKEGVTPVFPTVITLLTPYLQIDTGPGVWQK